MDANKPNVGLLPHKAVKDAFLSFSWSDAILLLAARTAVQHYSSKCCPIVGWM